MVCRVAELFAQRTDWQLLRSGTLGSRNQVGPKRFLGAALAGSILTSVLGAPLEIAFSSLVLEGGYGITMLAAIVVMAVITVPVAWVFYSW